MSVLTKGRLLYYDILDNATPSENVKNNSNSSLQRKESSNPFVLDFQNSENITEVDEKYGIVAMVDALGVKNYSNEELKKLIDHQLEISRETHEIISTITPSLFVNKPNIVVTKFGDTIVFCLEVEDKNYTGHSLLAMFHLMKYLMVKGLSDTVFYRGSISIGSYLLHKNQVLGAAINEAAEWHERIDWFGVVLTPKCQFNTISTIIEEKKKNPAFSQLIVESYIVEYPYVPTQQGDKELFSIAWPFEFLFIPHNQAISSVRNEITPLALFTSDIAESRIPVGTESKYYNTYKFFKWYEEVIFPNIRDAAIKLYN